MDAADAELAGRAEKYLRWSMFFLAASFVVIIIDWQLKKAIARQARVASTLYTDLVVRFGGEQGPAPAPADGGHLGGGGGGDRVDGTAPGPADHGGTGGAEPAAPAAAPRRAAGGAGRDGQ